MMKKEKQSFEREPPSQVTVGLVLPRQIHFMGNWTSAL